MTSATLPYRGCLAPSPTGPLHAGSLVAVLASWLDARAHEGAWLLRIEDMDTPRCTVPAAQTILSQLTACGLLSDEPVLWQSQRTPLYEQALETLAQRGAVYACRCSRSDINRRLAALGIAPERHREMPYPGSYHAATLACRPGLSVRLRVAHGVCHWQDRRLGAQQQDV
ncbi:MAG: tRNA glutamyl-Q(34) synthetase GluQRS, partial [Limnohabitans sp.]|nr:tRNA glutamyl-Q(34) synthetase GluQRS [Limnohabitans sp.]